MFTQANAPADAEDIPRYTVIQRDHNGRDINTITGLCQGDAKAMADILRTGTAYTSDKPWTLEVQRELSQAEVEERDAELWLTAPKADNRYFTSTSGMARAFELLAAHLRRVGDQPLSPTWLTLSFQVVSAYGDPEDARRFAADLLAEAFCLETPEIDENKHYGSRNGHLNIYAPGIAKPECKVTSFWVNEDATRGFACACGSNFDGFPQEGYSEFVAQHIADGKKKPAEPETVAAVEQEQPEAGASCGCTEQVADATCPEHGVKAFLTELAAEVAL